MTVIHNLGFPRIGAKRELKHALESYWKGESSLDALKEAGAGLRRHHWHQQAGLDLVPVGDFSFYDQVLDMSFTLGNLPQRVHGFHGEQLDNYFGVARGRSATSAGEHDDCCGGVAAGEMTKWFDTNYHYIVPEFSAATTFELDATRLLEQIAEAREQGVNAKPVIVGPVTYLAIGKARDDSNKLALLPALVNAYSHLLDTLARAGVEWVQVDEPLLVTELDLDWQHAFNFAYHQLKACPVKLLVASYFGALQENRYLAANLPVAGLHIDAVHGREDVLPLLNILPGHRVLSLGVINGRNIWKTDLAAVLDWLEPIAERLGERLWIAPSCSLLHVPVDLASEQQLDADIRSWLAFALQKLDELRVLGRALREGRAAVQEALAANAAALGRRESPYGARALLQAAVLELPAYPTATIGSFTQTPDISRPATMTVEWTAYAQSLTAKPMKGMLTGTVTILNWSFVRDDQPRALSCKQLALAIRAEVLELEQAGVRVIQIDEAALREGLPLRRAQWKDYLDWAVESFRITANGVADATQIHTHMCYSEFNDIIESGRAYPGRAPLGESGLRAEDPAVGRSAAGTRQYGGGGEDLARGRLISEPGGSSWRLARFESPGDGAAAMRAGEPEGYTLSFGKDGRLYTSLPADAGAYVWERIAP